MPQRKLVIFAWLNFNDEGEENDDERAQIVALNPDSGSLH
jgi:hypothetical protein